MRGTYNKNIKNIMASKSKELSNAVNGIQSKIYRKKQADFLAKREAFKQKATRPSVSKAGFIDPLGGVGTLTSNFKASRKSGIHGAVDIAAGAGTSVMASDAGTVVGIDYHEGGFGHVVAIQHANGLQTSYAHLKQAPNLKIGQTVQQGQEIGLLGNTGFSTGNHLDFRIGKKLYQNGAWNYAKDAGVVDPLSIINFKQPKNWLD